MSDRNLPAVYRCEWSAGRVWFHQRVLKVGERCPDGWFKSEELARRDMAQQLHRMAADLMRAAEGLTRITRGE